MRLIFHRLLAGKWESRREGKAAAVEERNYGERSFVGSEMLVSHYQ